MRHTFQVIEGGAAAGALSTGDPVQWRIDLRGAAVVSEGEIAAWRALVVRSGVADPIHADPAHVLAVARHQADGDNLVLAFAWAVWEGPARLGAVMPLSAPITRRGQARIVPWQPDGIAFAPVFANGREAALRMALAECLRARHPGAVLTLDAPVAAATPVVSATSAPAPRLRVVPWRAPVPTRAPSATDGSWIDAPDPIRAPPATFPLRGAEVSLAPIIADPSEAALVRMVTQLFAPRGREIVAANRGAGDALATSLGAGAWAVHGQRGTQAVAPKRSWASGLTPAGAESHASWSLGAGARSRDPVETAIARDLY